MSAEPTAAMSDDERAAAEWEAALDAEKTERAEQAEAHEVASELAGGADQVAPATFANFAPTGGSAGAGDELLAPR